MINNRIRIVQIIVCMLHRELLRLLLLLQRLLLHLMNLLLLQLLL